MTGSDSTLYKIEKVWYGSKLFNSPRQLAEEYQKGMTQKSYNRKSLPETEGDIGEKYPNLRQ
jgi:hypothetical protein